MKTAQVKAKGARPGDTVEYGFDEVHVVQLFIFVVLSQDVCARISVKFAFLPS